MGFKNLRFLESEILGNWVFVKAGLWESEILGKVDFDKVEFQERDFRKSHFGKLGF